MAKKRKILPSVLLTILSALGIFIGLSIASFSLIGIFPIPATKLAEPFSLFSTGSIFVLSLTICILNLLTLITSIKKLFGKNVKTLRQPKLPVFLITLAVWFIVLAVGYFAGRNEKWFVFLAPLTTTAILIPIWGLITIARSGLPRSTSQRERGTFTIGLTVAPLIIIITELVFIFGVIVVVMIILGFQSDLTEQLLSLLENLNANSSRIGELENMLFELMQQPLVATAIFVSLGVIAPLIEEIFKPMAIWLLLNRPLKDHEGYALGLISGGAFALLESTGMVIQMSPQEWLPAIALRAATGVLHIGLSGLVGYGLARSWSMQKRMHSVLYLLSAAALHGAWNSLALFSGLASMPLAEETGIGSLTTSSILSVVFMITIFIAVIVINIFINRVLRKRIKTAEIMIPDIL